MSERASITDSEAMRGFDLDLKRLSINLSHSLDFSECDCVSIIKAMLFLFM